MLNFCVAARDSAFRCPHKIDRAEIDSHIVQHAAHVVHTDRANRPRLAHARDNQLRDRREHGIIALRPAAKLFQLEFVADDRRFLAHLEHRDRRRRARHERFAQSPLGQQRLRRPREKGQAQRELYRSLGIDRPSIAVRHNTSRAK